MPSRVTINTNSLNVPWQLGTQYRIALDAGFVAEPANNKTGNPAVNNLVTFTTNATAPTLTSSSPSNDAFDVVNNTSVLLTFNRNVEAGAFNFSPFVPSGYVRLYEVGQNVDTLIKTFNLGDGADATISNNTISLNTTGLLAADSAYYLVFDSTAIRDIDNFNYAGTRTVKTVTAVGNAAANSAVVKWNGVPSVIFDGSGDYLSVPSSADFGYGTGAFIIEAWIRPTTATQTSVIVDHRPTATEGIYPTLRLQSGVLQYFVDSAVRITGTTITVNDWSFVQVARFSGVTRLYVNGVQVGASYTDSNTYPTAALTIGASGVNFSAGFAGYMSDIKISKAPIGLGGLRTRSSVNDEYTVLLIQGGVNDNAYTIFFDTQEEALGFPSLSASITGAFSPTISVRYTAAGQIVLASSVGISAIARKTARSTVNLTTQFSVAGVVPTVTRGINETFNIIVTQNTLAVGIFRPQSSLNSQTLIGFPRINVGSTANAVNNNFVLQQTINDIPNQTNSVFASNNDTFYNYGVYDIRPMPSASTHTPGIDSGKVEIYFAATVNTPRTLFTTITNPVLSSSQDTAGLPNNFNADYEGFGRRHLVVGNTLLIMQQNKMYVTDFSSIVSSWARPEAGLGNDGLPASGSQQNTLRGHVFQNIVAVGWAGRVRVYNQSSGALLYTLVDPDRNDASNNGVGQNDMREVRVNSDYCLFYNDAGGSTPTKRSASLFNLNDGTFMQGFEQSDIANLALSQNANEIIVNNVLYVRNII